MFMFTDHDQDNHCFGVETKPPPSHCWATMGYDTKIILVLAGLQLQIEATLYCSLTAKFE